MPKRLHCALENDNFERIDREMHQHFPHDVGSVNLRLHYGCNHPPHTHSMDLEVASAYHA